MGSTLNMTYAGGGSGTLPSLLVTSNKTGAAVTAKKITGKQIGTLAIGDTVKMTVDGVPTEFLIVHKGKPSSMYDDSFNDGVILLMKDCYESRQWHSSNVNDYANSTIHSYLNSTFLNLFDDAIKSQIKQVKVPYRPGSGTSTTVNSGANGLSAKIFLLSGYEMGWTNSDDQYFPADGAKLDYFDSGTGTTANNKRIGYLNGSATFWWLRSPHASSATNAWLVDTNGNYSGGNCSNSYGVRPALVIPSSAQVDDDGNIVIGNDDPTIPLTEIEAGVYWGEVTDYGEWEVTAALGGDISSDTVEVTAVELYEADCSFVPADVNDASWELISEISQAGTGDTFWDVGDTKAITLNGTVGTKSYSSVTLYLFILHFNMPVNKSVTDNNIIWGGFKTAKTGGVDVCLDDSYYGSNKTDGTKAFNMNHWGSSTYSPYSTNYGGWVACDLRYDILGAVSTAPSPYGSTKTTSATGSNATQAAITSPISNTLMAALPSDFRNVLRLWTRWVDNTGNNSNVDASITAIVDAGISLLTEFEVYGKRTYANQYEQNHQVQCAYYVAGNSKIKYRQSRTGDGADWWESSSKYSVADNFCCVSASGVVGSNTSRASYALAPAFKT